MIRTVVKLSIMTPDVANGKSKKLNITRQIIEVNDSNTMYLGYKIDNEVCNITSNRCCTYSYIEDEEVAMGNIVRYYRVRIAANIAYFQDRIKISNERLEKLNNGDISDIFNIKASTII